MGPPPPEAATACRIAKQSGGVTAAAVDAAALLASRLYGDDAEGGGLYKITGREAMLDAISSAAGSHYCAGSDESVTIVPRAPSLSSSSSSHAANLHSNNNSNNNNSTAKRQRPQSASAASGRRREAPRATTPRPGSAHSGHRGSSYTGSFEGYGDQQAGSNPNRRRPQSARPATPAAAVDDGGNRVWLAKDVSFQHLCDSVGAKAVLRFRSVNNCFKHIETHDGYVQQDEFRRFLRGLNVQQEQTDSLLAALDESGTGEVELNLLKGLIGPYIQPDYEPPEEPTAGRPLRPESARPKSSRTVDGEGPPMNLPPRPQSARPSLTLSAKHSEGKAPIDLNLLLGDPPSYSGDSLTEVAPPQFDDNVMQVIAHRARVGPKHTREAFKSLCNTQEGHLTRGQVRQFMARFGFNRLVADRAFDAMKSPDGKIDMRFFLQTLQNYAIIPPSRPPQSTRKRPNSARPQSAQAAAGLANPNEYPMPKRPQSARASSTARRPSTPVAIVNVGDLTNLPIRGSDVSGSSYKSCIDQVRAKAKAAAELNSGPFFPGAQLPREKPSGRSEVLNGPRGTFNQVSEPGNAQNTATATMRRGSMHDSAAMKSRLCQNMTFDPDSKIEDPASAELMLRDGTNSTSGGSLHDGSSSGDAGSFSSEGYGKDNISVPEVKPLMSKNRPRPPSAPHSKSSARSRRCAEPYGYLARSLARAKGEEVPSEPDNTVASVTAKALTAHQKQTMRDLKAKTSEGHQTVGRCLSPYACSIFAGAASGGAPLAGPSTKWRGPTTGPLVDRVSLKKAIETPAVRTLCRTMVQGWSVL